jgi:hypothetical protein
MAKTVFVVERYYNDGKTDDSCVIGVAWTRPGAEKMMASDKADLQKICDRGGRPPLSDYYWDCTEYTPED